MIADAQWSPKQATSDRGSSSAIMACQGMAVYREREIQLPIMVEVATASRVEHIDMLKDVLRT